MELKKKQPQPYSFKDSKEWQLEYAYLLAPVLLQPVFQRMATWNQGHVSVIAFHEYQKMIFFPFLSFDYDFLKDVCLQRGISSLSGLSKSQFYSSLQRKPQ